MSTVILGIDPGLTGAYAALSESGEILALDDLPVIRDAGSAWIDADVLLSALIALRSYSSMTAVIERIHAMPRNGSKGAFSQGCTFASTLATLQIARARIEFVTPVTWKRSLGLVDSSLTDTERKKRSLDKARLLFPNVDLSKQKHHGRAEALLIAHWYLKTQQREAA